MFKLLLFVAAIQLLVSAVPDDLIVTLPNGKVQGAKYIAPNNVSYYGWRGIPYATPPVGELRFEPTEKLPVLFWIYGGGFTSGSSLKSLYGPDFLVQEDVVLVTFNYRLSAFGFLSTGDTAIRGNAGLKDQNLALKWTNDNIGLFGGDPEKITIFGQSAGGASTGLHLVSKKSSGLFRAAIVESGAALDSFAIKTDRKSYAFLLADTIGGGNYGNDTQKLKEFLLEKSPEQIINATNALPVNTDNQISPVVEVEDEDAFITESPYELLKSGRFNKVPITIGICAEESLMFLKDLDTARQMALSFDTFPNTLIPQDLRPNSSDENAVIAAIQNIYLAEGETFSSNLVATADIYSDIAITTGVIKHAELTSNYTFVYLYQFSYYGREITPAYIDGAEKASHSAELPFIFNMDYYSNTTSTGDLATQNTMVKLWTNFAKFLNPTPDTSDLLWPTISPDNLTYLNINETLEVRQNLKGSTYPQWNKIYQTYGKRPFITY